uniref:Uncharacterized protein n=1 Tax=blood disease bacterium R229 TaxID=741978 RepID=G2ZSN0_9RALS|nr:hypothetical protein BDB_180083 [blood disease bacterium R229]
MPAPPPVVSLWWRRNRDSRFGILRVHGLPQSGRALQSYGEAFSRHLAIDVAWPFAEALRLVLQMPGRFGLPIERGCLRIRPRLL